MIKRPPAGSIPDAPGSYQFKDALGRVIYVGKASSLRQRLSNYFQAPHNLHPRTRQMVETAESVEWTIVRNEVEALMLEYSLIKQHRPRFNIRLRDDKSYPFLAVTLDDEWPRAMVMRGRKRKGVRYFGPYAHAYAIRETLDMLLRTFPIRTCSDNKFLTHQRLGRPDPRLDPGRDLGVRELQHRIAMGGVGAPADHGVVALGHRPVYAWLHLLDRFRRRLHALECRAQYPFVGRHRLRIDARRGNRPAVDLAVEHRQ